MWCCLISEHFKGGKCAELVGFSEGEREFKDYAIDPIDTSPFGECKFLFFDTHPNPPGSGTLINKGFEYRGLYL